MSYCRIILLIAIAAATTPLLLPANTPAPKPQTELQDIDNQIQSLEAELKDLRRDAFNKEMNAQPYMFDNWEEYTHKISGNENDEKKIITIKAKIVELNKRKQALLNLPHE